MKWIVLVALAVGFILYNFLTNLLNMLRLKRYYKDFMIFAVHGIGRDVVLSSKRDVLDLLIGAGITDTNLPHVEEVGHGMVATATKSVMKNYGVRSDRICDIFTSWFDEAIGTYENRMWNSLNPLKWVDIVIFLPARIMKYLGLSTDTIATRIIHLVWWIVTPLALIFRDNIAEYIRLLFQ